MSSPGLAEPGQPHVADVCDLMSLLTLFRFLLVLRTHRAKVWLGLGAQRGGVVPCWSSFQLEV